MTQSCHNSDLEINFLTEISPHEVSWDEHRSDAESVKILYNYSVELSKYADRINGCSGILKFGVNPDQGKLVLKQAFFCRVRHCPVCQWRRSLLWRAVMFQQLPKIQELYPTHRWVFLTMTVRNPPIVELRDTLKHMNESWQRLIQTKAFKSGVAGFIRTTEVTRGKDAEMMSHPHYHALLLVKPGYFSKYYINQSQWVEMWAKALRADYLPSVNVKAIRVGNNEKSKKALEKQICETLKYSVKPSDLAVEHDKGAWLHEMTKQVHKMRFVATGGVLKGILKPDDEITNEEMISSSEEPQDVGEGRVAFQFNSEYRRYIYAPKYNEYAE